MLFLAVREVGGVKMQRSMKAWICVCLTLGLAAGGMPAEASEVVKLARLVVSGKRSTNEAPRSAPTARTGGATTQNHGSGGSDAAGTAPAPTRGVS